MNRLEALLAQGNTQRYTEDDFTSRITCADGFSVSVIAGGGAYSTPRSAIPGPRGERREGLGLGMLPSDYPGPYTTVEVGFPSTRPEPWENVDPKEGWRFYAEEPDEPTETVYGYVPSGMVRDLLAAHGGEA